MITKHEKVPQNIVIDSLFANCRKSPVRVFRKRPPWVPVDIAKWALENVHSFVKFSYGWLPHPVQSTFQCQWHEAQLEVKVKAGGLLKKIVFLRRSEAQMIQR